MPKETVIHKNAARLLEAMPQQAQDGLYPVGFKLGFIQRFGVDLLAQGFHVVIDRLGFIKEVEVLP